MATRVGHFQIILRQMNAAPYVVQRRCMLARVGHPRCSPRENARMRSHGYG